MWRCQLLLMTAQDDPFVPYVSFLRARVEENPRVRFVAPEHGGHCGFISKLEGRSDFGRRRGLWSLRRRLIREERETERRSKEKQWKQNEERIE